MAAIRTLLDMPDVERVTCLRLEIGGPLMGAVIGDADLSGDDTESHVPSRLRALEAKTSASPAATAAVLSLPAPDELSLRPNPGRNGASRRGRLVMRGSGSTALALATAGLARRFLTPC